MFGFSCNLNKSSTILSSYILIHHRRNFNHRQALPYLLTLILNELHHLILQFLLLFYFLHLTYLLFHINRLSNPDNFILNFLWIELFLLFPLVEKVSINQLLLNLLLVVLCLHLLLKVDPFIQFPPSEHKLALFIYPIAQL